MPEIIPNFHPFFVHFTIALIVISFLTLLGANLIKCIHKYAKYSSELFIASRWCLWIGAIAAILTVGAGFYAYSTVTSHGMNSHMAMLTHRKWALATLAVIIILALCSVILHIKNQQPKWFFTLGMLIAFLGVMITGFYGSELVYRFGLGVIPVSKMEAKGHSHGDHNMIKKMEMPEEELNNQHSDGHNHSQALQNNNALIQTSESNIQQNHGDANHDH